MLILLYFAVLSLLSFIVSTESGERISLVITNLLALTVFMLIVADILPPTSEVVPLISTFLTCSIVEVWNYRMNLKINPGNASWISNLDKTSEAKMARVRYRQAIAMHFRYPSRVITNEAIQNEAQGKQNNNIRIIPLFPAGPRFELLCLWSLDQDIESVSFIFLYFFKFIAPLHRRLVEITSGPRVF